MAKIKTREEIVLLRESGKRLARVLRLVRDEIRAGVSTKHLDLVAERLIRETGDEPPFLRYTPYGARRPFPASLCVSVNDEIVHGIPSEERIIEDGDIVSIDLGLSHKDMITIRATFYTLLSCVLLTPMAAFACGGGIPSGVDALWMYALIAATLFFTACLLWSTRSDATFFVAGSFQFFVMASMVVSLVFTDAPFLKYFWRLLGDIASYLTPIALLISLAALVYWVFLNIVQWRLRVSGAGNDLVVRHGSRIRHSGALFAMVVPLFLVWGITGYFSPSLCLGPDTVVVVPPPNILPP